MKNQAINPGKSLKQVGKKKEKEKERKTKAGKKKCVCNSSTQDKRLLRGNKDKCQVLESERTHLKRQSRKWLEKTLDVDLWPIYMYPHRKTERETKIPMLFYKLDFKKNFIKLYSCIFKYIEEI